MATLLLPIYVDKNHIEHVKELLAGIKWISLAPPVPEGEDDVDYVPLTKEQEIASIRQALLEVREIEAGRLPSRRLKDVLQELKKEQEDELHSRNNA